MQKPFSFYGDFYKSVQCGGRENYPFLDIVSSSYTIYYFNMEYPELDLIKNTELIWDN